MDRTVALAEIQRMKAAETPGVYLSALSVEASKPNGELPVQLSESHSRIVELNEVIARQNLNQAKLTVAMAVQSDAGRIKTLIENGRITPAVANKLIALCEEKRAEQIVRLADGQPDAAQGQDSDIANILDLLGELPAQAAAPAAPTADAAVPGQDPTAAASGMSEEDQIDALARQLMKSEGIPYDQAVVAAQKQIASAGAAAPATAGVA